LSDRDSGGKAKKLAAVETEIARERAESLARGVQRLRSTLAALRGFDAGAIAGKERARLVSEAAQACLAYLVQREVMGLGAQDATAIRTEFEVPQEVWNNMGAMPRF
jgi:hypothetical protein